MASGLPSRTLLVMRHGKAAWPDDVPDHERPLAARGRRDSPAVGRWLVEQDVVPDLVLVSDAVRTRETAVLVLSALPEVRSVTTSELYEASVSRVLALVAAVDPDVRRLLLVGHEPTSSALVAVLTGGSPAFPTAALAVVDVRVPWADVTAGCGDLTAMRTPRG